MNTFLPYKDFLTSAKCLDVKRLGKQRVEVLQLLNTLKQGPVRDGKKTPWYNHPACKMWQGYEMALAQYGEIVCSVWIDMGFKDTCYDKIKKHMVYFSRMYNTYKIIFPPWLGNEDFHRSHRSNLLRKYPAYYGIFFKDVPDNLPYIWPVE